MPTLQGTGISFDQSASSRQIRVERRTALTIFENAAITQRDAEARALGLYGQVSVGRDLKAQFATLSTPRHMFRKRGNGCTWNPKGGMRMNVDSFPTCAIEYDGEQCPDAFYQTCFEQIFGTGRGAYEFAATEEGQKLFAAMLRKIYAGLGNSFNDLSNYANHPLIKQANLAGFYKVTVKEWEDYIDQQLSGECGGLITQLDELAALGTQGYTRGLAVDSNMKYTGNFVTDLEALLGDATAELTTAVQSGVTLDNGTTRYPIVLATSEVFDSYKAQIRAMAGTNELAYRYMLEGGDGTTKMMRNVLTYDNMPVVRWDSNNAFDAITGAKQHRLAVVVPGMFGVLHDVDDLAQYNGMGLVVEQSKSLKDKGKVFMNTTLRWGAGIANPDLVAMASTVLHPN